MIPKIIHQIWVGDEKKMPKKHIETWKRFHPDWIHLLWTENDISKLNLINLDKYDKYYKEKCYNGAANVLRVEIINQFGGIYIDADSICTNSMDDLCELDFFAVYSPNIKGRVGNAFFGSVKNHQILTDYIKEIGKLTKIHPSWSTTGGTTFGKVIKKFNAIDKVLPSYTFYTKNSSNKPIAIKGKNYGTHYWGTTHKSY